MARSGKHRKLGTAAERVVKRLDRSGEGLRQVRATRAWRAVAGDQILAHTTGVFVRGKQLVVYVDSPVWASELQAMAEQFRHAVNEEAGQDLVRSMRFTVRRRSASDTEEVPPAREAVRAESTDEEKQRIWASTGELRDAKLREAAYRARLADFEWKKGSEAESASQKPPDGARGPKSGT